MSIFDHATESAKRYRDSCAPLLSSDLGYSLIMDAQYVRGHMLGHQKSLEVLKSVTRDIFRVVRELERRDLWRARSL